MILVTISVERQDLIDLGVSTEGEDVECAINPDTICAFYPSHDDGKNHKGTKIHLSNGEHIWCYEGFYDILARIKKANED